MNVKIEIDCESISELISHLIVIRKEVKAKAKEKNLHLMLNEFPAMEWEDSNCYGEHYVKITEEYIATMKTTNQ